MDEINGNDVKLMALSPEVNPKDRMAYIAVEIPFTPGLSHDDVVKAYNEWAVKGEYEEVGYMYTK